LDDVAHVMLAFEDGSTAAIHYLSNGARSYPKERVDCFFDGKCFTVDNWRRLQTYGVSKSWLNLPRRMDKGHAEEVKAWVRAIRGGGPSPIPLEEIMEVSRWSIRAAELARGRESVER
jgi:predicted dehydrogenase